jgi:peptidyl-prolyl cis-trans isomerase B (cyclophilin B)
MIGNGRGEIQTGGREQARVVDEFGKRGLQEHGIESVVDKSGQPPGTQTMGAFRQRAYPVRPGRDEIRPPVYDPGMIALSALDLASAVNGARHRAHAKALRRCACLAAILALLGGSGISAQQPRPRRPPAPPPQPARLKADLTAEQMKGKQALVETPLGTFVIELLPDLAPSHVAYVMKLAREGAYDGTTFHRAIRHGIIQGGDPLSKDPAKAAQYGTGGLGVLDAETNNAPMTRAAVAAVLQPGRANSGGAQFFVLVTDQPSLQGQYTIFGRVVEGMEVVQKISEASTDANGRVTDRIEMTRVTIRDAPPPEPEPFTTQTVDELARYRAVLETSKGPIAVAFFADKAPEHVRNFLRLASLGAYDGTAFHRVVRGFVIQGGMLNTRKDPVPQRAQRYVRTLAPEFNDTPHVKGILSMARTDDPNSASTSFFICTGPAPSLDGKYTAFGQVVGLATVDTIDAAPVEGETPRERLEVTKVTVTSS